MMTNKRINLDSWINENTINSVSVIELGAGFFRRLKSVHDSVTIKIGVEIYQPYIDNAVYDDCIKIHGDALKYKELLKDYYLDTVLLVDVLEHFDKEVGFKLIEDLKKDFNKIVLMLPAGKYVQEEDVTGYEGHEYQKHRSYWYIDDIEKLNFDVNIIDPHYHQTNHMDNDENTDTSCYFGVWNKNK